MAAAATRPVVTTSATLLAANPTASDPSYGGGDDFRTTSFVLKNVTGTAAIFVGAAGVTTATGFQWDAADGPLSFDLEAGEEVYGVVASGTQNVHAFRVGR